MEPGDMVEATTRLYDHYAEGLLAAEPGDIGEVWDIGRAWGGVEVATVAFGLRVSVVNVAALRMCYKAL